MKKGIHPEYNEISVTCSCGNKFKVKSTLKENLSLDVCANCHPFYTKQQKIVDTTGRVERFKQRYAMPGVSDEKTKEKATIAEGKS